MVVRGKPRALVLSACTLFSMRKNLAKSGMPWIRCPEAWEEAKAFVNFAVELARLQHQGGRGFVFEHPWLASSWKLTDLKELMVEKGIFEVRLDMCRFGMTQTNFITTLVNMQIKQLKNRYTNSEISTDNNRDT